MIPALFSRLVILVFGTLYPAYASYKAVKTKNVKEYVKWMMYWIVFALFTALETFADVLLGGWFPFYYDIKILFVMWLLSPATRGSSFLYRKFVHPTFSKKEKDIDEMIAKASEQGYSTVLSLGHRGLTYASRVVLQTAMKGQSSIANQFMRKSYSMDDISDRPRRRSLGDYPEPIIDEDEEDTIDDPMDNRYAEEREDLYNDDDQNMDRYSYHSSKSHTNRERQARERSPYLTEDDLYNDLSDKEPLRRSASVRVPGTNKRRTKKSHTLSAEDAYATLPRSRRSTRSTISSSTYR